MRFEPLDFTWRTVADSRMEEITGRRRALPSNKRNCEKGLFLFLRLCAPLFFHSPIGSATYSMERHRTSLPFGFPLMRAIYDRFEYFIARTAVHAQFALRNYRSLIHRVRAVISFAHHVFAPHSVYFYFFLFHRLIPRLERVP